MRRIQTPVITLHHGCLAELCQRQLRKAMLPQPALALSCSLHSLTSTHMCDIGTERRNERCVSNQVTVNFV